MESGNITRQEAVSMLPPLFLDVHPKHLVRERWRKRGGFKSELAGVGVKRGGKERQETKGYA